MQILTRRQAIVHSCISASSTLPDLFRVASIFGSTKGALFFGTPHLGSDWSAFHKTVLDILKTVTNSNTNLVKHLIPSSEVLRDVQNRYVQISGNISNVFFVEQYPTPVSILGKRLVRCRLASDGTSSDNYARDSLCRKSQQRLLVMHSCE